MCGMDGVCNGYIEAAKAYTGDDTAFTVPAIAHMEAVIVRKASKTV